jgi:hypothetical protein
MKVIIGDYPTWWGPYQICNLLHKYLGVSDDVCDKIAGYIPVTPFQWFYDTFQHRKVKVRIDKYDPWSADHTLALIILPLLKRLKEDKHGSPFVDDADVPDGLKSIAASPKENEWETDEFHHDRWDYVLDEMIWAFEGIVRDDYVEKFSPFSSNIDDYKAHVARMQRGTTLFGKYYQGLWS